LHGPAVSVAIIFSGGLAPGLRLIFNILKKIQPIKSVPKKNVNTCISMFYNEYFEWMTDSPAGFKVIHTPKNLFCYVVLICNLVQEFNGLVSKGPAI
jgi:hypothetical protein